MPTSSRTRTATASVAVGGSVMPGLGIAATGTGVAALVVAITGVTSLLVVAVALGVLVANTGMLPASAAPGLRLVARRVLRVGVVLLGLRLDLVDVADLGGRGLLAVLAVVVVTFFGTQWLARRLALPRGQGMLVATGFSICGVSAIAAMESTADAAEDDVAVSVALVTLCGTLAIVLLPVVGGWLGLESSLFGAWAGASVHDVAQVIATASTAGPDAVTSAVTVKLTRVVLLAPLVVAVSVWSSRGWTGPSRDASTVRPTRMWFIPLFVVGFVAAAALRSTGWLPTGVLDLARSVESLLFGAAMFALGTGVRLNRLRHLGLRPVVLGLLAWVLVAGTSLAAVTLTHGS